MHISNKPKSKQKRSLRKEVLENSSSPQELLWEVSLRAAEAQSHRKQRNKTPGTTF